MAGVQPTWGFNKPKKRLQKRHLRWIRTQSPVLRNLVRRLKHGVKRPRNSR